MPHSVFTCDTLKCLVLDIPCILQVPPINCFSNLTKLNIVCVTFWHDYTTLELFSGQPNLKVLVLMKCKWKFLEDLTISNPNLPSLTITEAYLRKWDDFDGNDFDEGSFDGNDFWPHFNFVRLRFLGSVSNIFLTLVNSSTNICYATHPH